MDGRLDEIVLRTLEKDPVRRHQRVSEVKTDMEAMAGGLPSPVPVAAPIRSFQDEVELEMHRLQVIGPAIGLIVVSILGLVHWTIILVVTIVEDWYLHRPNSHAYWVDIGLAIGIIGTLVVVSATIVMAGGRRMMRFENYNFVMLATLWTMLPWSGFVWFIGLGMGLWALNVLRRPEVKMAFVRTAVHARLSAPFPAAPTGPYHGKLQSMFGAVGSLFFRSRANYEDPVPAHTLAPATQVSLTPLTDEAPRVAGDTPFPVGSPATMPRARNRSQPALWNTLILVVIVMLVVLTASVGFVTFQVEVPTVDSSDVTANGSSQSIEVPPPQTARSQKATGRGH